MRSSALQMKVHAPARFGLRTLRRLANWSRKAVTPILLLFVALLTLSSEIGHAVASDCLELQGRLNSMGANGQELSALKRQLAAIRGLEAQRHCVAGKSGGGWFDVCGDLAGRRQAVQSKISGSSGFGAGLRPQYVALGCDAKRAAPRDQSSYQRGPSSTLPRNAVLFCVRSADGYYFPSPNSQFAREDDLKTTIDRCRYICDHADMDVYALPDVTQETEAMVSVASGKSYKDLPAAFKYRDDQAFKGCDLDSYVRKVDELRAQTVTPSDTSNALIPLPGSKPEMAAYSAIEPVNGRVAQAPAERPMPDRKVRQVGPVFLPDN